VPNTPTDGFLPPMSSIAREAGALLMHYFHQHLKIEYKGDADLVTAADRAAEALIRDRIRARWPTHDVLGEEQGLSDQGSDYRWYVCLLYTSIPRWCSPSARGMRMARP